MVTAIEMSGDPDFAASSPTYLEGAWVESDVSATALCIHGSQKSRAKGRTAMNALLTIFFLSKRFWGGPLGVSRRCGIHDVI
jgi:hypothetical protein